jgi:hypothetical protein
MFSPFDSLRCIQSRDPGSLLALYVLEEGLKPVRLILSMLDRPRNRSELPSDEYHVSSLSGRHPSPRHSIRVCLHLKWLGPGQSHAEDEQQNEHRTEVDWSLFLQQLRTEMSRIQRIECDWLERLLVLYGVRSRLLASLTYSTGSPILWSFAGLAI